MGGMPDVAVVFSVKDEQLAIHESNCIGIPVIGIVDTNCSPAGVNFPIPSNDDSQKVIDFYGNLFNKAIIAGMKFAMSRDGVKKEEIDNAVNSHSKKTPTTKD